MSICCNFILCHLRIKSTPFLMGIKFKIAHLFGLTGRHNLKKQKGYFRLCLNCIKDFHPMNLKNFLTAISMARWNRSTSKRFYGSRKVDFSCSWNSIKKILGTSRFNTKEPPPPRIISPKIEQSILKELAILKKIVQNQEVPLTSYKLKSTTLLRERRSTCVSTLWIKRFLKSNSGVKTN